MTALPRISNHSLAEPRIASIETVSGAVIANEPPHYRPVFLIGVGEGDFLTPVVGAKVLIDNFTVFGSKNYESIRILDNNRRW